MTRLTWKLPALAAAAVAMALGSLATPAYAAPAPVNFAPHFDYTAGAGAYAVAVGDFNGDGHPDLVTANGSDNNVSVLLDTSEGTFQTQKTYATGNGPASVAVADFNGDGHPDVVTGNATDNNVSVLLGTGDGTFQKQKTYPTGTGPNWVAVGDFNGDGHPDMAVANDGSNNVTVLLGNGDGTFTAASGSPVSVGSGPASLAVGDFNGDGHQDLAVANSSTNDNTVSVLLGNGMGGFTATSGSPISVGGQPYSVAIGDFNGDGHPDLAVANEGDSTVSVLLGDGTGAFTAASGSPYSTGLGPNWIAVADFNGDHRPDLAIANVTDGSVSVLLNAPTADADKSSLSFGSPAPVPRGTVSPPQTMTITNNGSAPLTISGFAFGGADPNDFLISSDTCHAPVAPGGTCTVSVRFLPQSQGSRQAFLSVLTNAPISLSITLAGSAGPLPQRPPGATGHRGPQGPKGHPGQNAIVHVLATCTSKKASKRVRCHVTLQVTHTAGAARARLTRGARLYATGRQHGRRLTLRNRRALRPGRYTLTLTWRNHHGQVRRTHTIITVE